MYAKLQITGNIEIVTGLHIGDSDAFAAIGAVDSSVIRDKRTKRPIIPGSSLKGKMRTLLVRSRSESVVLNSCNKDAPEILRLFGGSEPGSDGRLPHSRLKFSDCFMSNADELIEKDIGLTEVKFENTINRQTSVANPRQIERVVRGAIFAFELMYDMDDETKAAEDFQVIREGLSLIEYDYLGGHGSRGSGRVKFTDLSVKVVFGSVSKQIMEECKKQIKDVE